MEGTCKFFDERKGFGFIVGTDDIEYFAHISQIPTGMKKLLDNQEVTFEPEQGDRGPKATKINLKESF